MKKTESKADIERRAALKEISREMHLTLDEANYVLANEYESFIEIRRAFIKEQEMRFKSNFAIKRQEVAADTPPQVVPQVSATFLRYFELFSMYQDSEEAPATTSPVIRAKNYGRM